MNTGRALDPDIRRELIVLLSNLPGIDDPTARGALYSGLPAQFRLSIPRSPTPLVELGNIVDATWAYHDPDTGRWGLGEVIAAAMFAVEGTPLAAQLLALRDRLVPPPISVDLAVLATVPATPEAGYVASGCQEAPPLLDAVVPTAADKVYTAAVIARYQAWRDEAGYGFVSGGVLAPAGFVPGEVIHRRVPDGGGLTAQLWSLCRTINDLQDHRRLLVLGRPGIGKTTLLRFLARRYASLQGALLPVVVSLRAWHDPPGAPRTFVEFVKAFLAAPSDPRDYPRGGALAAQLDSYLADPLLQYRLVFLLDDYNRMSRDDPADYLRQVREIRRFAATYTGVALVVASRALDYDGLLADDADPADPFLDFEVVELNPWGRAQIAEYLRRQAPALLAEATRDPRLMARLLDLGEIPYQLAQIVAILSRPGAVPANLLRSAQDLLGAFVDSLLAFSEQTGRGNPAWRRHVCAGLGRLAAGLRRDHQPGSYVHLPAAVSYLGAAEAAPAPEQVLDIAADATILDIDLGPRQVGFETQTLEDYFAHQEQTPDTRRAALAVVTAGAGDPLQMARLADQFGLLDGEGDTVAA